MRNRAKCKKCNDVLESFVEGDYVTCSCGNISIGPRLYAAAMDWDTFVRVDDNDHEIHVKYEDKREKKDEQVDKDKEAHKPTKEQLIRMLEEMIKSYENLPQRAMEEPVTHADHKSLLMLVSSLFKSI